MRRYRPEKTAARHLARNVPRARPEARAADVWAGLVGARFDSVEIICVTDPDGRLQGVIRLADLLAASAETPAAELMDPHPHVRPGDDQEHVASEAVRHGVGAVPVVDEGRRLLGVVPAPAIIGVLRREHVEDLHRLTGIRHETDLARQALEEPARLRVHDRLPWLLVGLAGSFLATFVIARFEPVLERRVAVAFFVPGIVYLADAIGTQTEAIAVRGLSLSRAPFRSVLLGELLTGLLIGLFLGLLAFPAVWLAFGDPRLGVAVALALTAAGTVATTIGLLLPWLFARAGRDPALGSGPVATIIQDVLSLVIYFLIVQGIVR